MIYFTSKKHLKTLFISILSKNNSSLFFLLLFSILTGLFPNSFAFCQFPSTTTQDSTELTTSNSLDSSSLAQKIKTNFSIGFRGGITRGELLIANPKKNDQNAPNIGSVLTIFTNYKINSHFSLQPELAIGRYRSDNTLYNVALLQGRVDYTISTFDLNLVGIYSYSITNRFSISAEVGGSVAYLHNSFGAVVAPNTRIGGNYDVNADDQFEKFNYGILVGITPSFNLKRVTLQTSIRYRYGLNNINTFDYSLNRYLTDSNRTIQTRDILFQVGFLIPIYKDAKIQE